MKNLRFLIVSAIFCLSTTLVFAQAKQDKGYYGKMFDPKTIETVSGKVILVEKTENGKNIVLETEPAKDKINVHLGPDFFLDKQEVQVQATDKVTITGSKVMIDGKLYIIASELKKGDKTVIIRDAKGFPAWKK